MHLTYSRNRVFIQEERSAARVHQIRNRKVADSNLDKLFFHNTFSTSQCAINVK